MNYDRVATAIAAEHETFVADLRSLMLGLRLAGGITPLSGLQVQAGVARSREAFLRAANAVAHDHLAEVFVGAPLTSGETRDRTIPFLRELSGITHDEIRQFNTKIRGSGLMGIVGPRPPFAQLAKRADESFAPTARDGAGRVWQAGALVRFLARDFAYQAHIDGKVAALLAAGESKAQIVWTDPNHDDNGLVVDLPLAPDLRYEFFHPNANAQLAHVPAQ